MGLFDSIGDAIGGVIGLFGSGDGGKEDYERALRILEEVQDPNFNFRDLSAPVIPIAGEYTPFTYSPEFASSSPALADDSPMVRAEQLKALQHLSGVAEEGLPLAERLAAEQQGARLADEASRYDASIIRNLAERGRAGGGTELAARMASAQRLGNLAHGIGSDLATQAALNRISASGQVGALGGAIRGQDIALSEQRANALNRFNEWASSFLTQAAQQNALAQERAQTRNIGTAQDVASTNELNRYNTQQQNLTRNNALEQALANFRLRRAQSQAGASQDLGNANYAEQASRMEQLRGLGSGIGAGVGALSGVLFPSSFEQEPYIRA